jgi:hypothetical protein
VFLDAASRNAERFPENFMFQLTLEDVELSRSQIRDHEDGRTYRDRGPEPVTGWGWVRIFC